MNVRDLIAALTKAVADDPKAGDRLVLVEGCDCYGVASGKLEPMKWDVHGEDALTEVDALAISRDHDARAERSF